MKLAIIGLDCADPKLVFEEFWDDLPNIRRIAEQGDYSPMESTIPPITVPAWMSMVTGKDPGELGIYGFRNRKDFSYSNLIFANSKMIKYETVWDTLGRYGYKSVILGVPLTYPPKPLKGYLISGFLAPSTKSDYTYPSDLKFEIEKLVGSYMLDVENFRTNDKERLLRDLYRLTEQRFEVARHMITSKEWDFFMMVDMGIDRLHHGFWAYHDPTHFKHDPNSPFKNAIRDFYKFVDEKIGELLNVLPNDTDVMIVSDHGIKRMDGGIAINDWLIEKGYLKLKNPVEKPTRISELIKKELIDWEHTMAWGEGGYYGRIFINVEGREPNGIVKNYHEFRDKLKEELEGITDEYGNNINTRVFKPEEIYKKVNNISPDLIVYFGNLSWRSIGTVGNESIWLHENDTGPDDANHDQFGIAVTSFKNAPKVIYEVHDIVLKKFGIDKSS